MSINNYENYRYSPANSKELEVYSSEGSTRENAEEIEGERGTYRQAGGSLSKIESVSANWHRVIRGKMYADVPDGDEFSVTRKRPFRIEDESAYGKEMAHTLRAESIYAMPRPEGFQARTREPSQVGEVSRELKYWPIQPSWSQEVLWRADSPGMSDFLILPPAPPPTEVSGEELVEIGGEYQLHVEPLEEIAGEEWRWVEGRWSWHEIRGEHDEEFLGEDDGLVRKIWVPGYWAPTEIPEEIPQPLEDVSPMPKTDRATEILNMEFRAPSPEAGNATTILTSAWKYSETSDDFMIAQIAPSKAAEETRESLKLRMAAVEELIFPKFMKMGPGVIEEPKEKEPSEITPASEDVLKSECPPIIDPIPEEFRYLLVNFVVDFLKEKPKNVEEWGLSYFLNKKEHFAEDIVDAYLSDRRCCIFSPSPLRESEPIDVPVFKKSEEDKMSIIMSLKEVFLFFSIDVESLAVVVDAIFERKVCANDVIIKQGDFGEFFYVIKEGEFDVLEERQEKVTKVAHYENKGSFGELALMYDEPRRATVVAATDGRLWCLARDTFKGIVMRKAWEKREEYSGFISAVPLFESLSVEEKNSLIDCLIPKYYNEGDVIIKQGENADGMYIVERGTIRSSIRGRDGNDVLLQRTRRGGFFGELGLLTNQPRAATVRALSQVKVLFIEKSSFERLMGPCIEIMERNKDEYLKEIEVVLARASAFKSTT